MKPVIIIALAVVCSVVAVFAVSISLQEIAIYQYNEESNDEQMRIVTAYNQEIQRCRTVFVNNFMGEIQCKENAVGNFQIYVLDNEHYQKLAFIPLTAEEEMNMEKYFEENPILPRTYSEAKQMSEQLTKQIQNQCEIMHGLDTTEYDECINYTP